MTQNQKVIYTADNMQLAEQLKHRLEKQGIAAVVAGEVPLGWPASHQVIVDEKDAEAARQVAGQFEQDASLAAHSRALLGDLTESDETDWDQWPRCPRCDQRRQAVCPLCEASGSDFHLADLVTSDQLGQKETELDEQQEEEPAVLLLCPNCDEAFQPRFYRTCQQCGHEFGDGVSIESAPGEEVTNRTVMVMIALALGLLGLLAYFWYLFR